MQKSPAGSMKSLDMSVDETSIAGNMLSDEDEATDYVFRIITTFRPDHLREFG